MINLEDKVAVIVGGGKVAYRKAVKLLEYGAKVKVISPKFFNMFGELEESYLGILILIEDEYKEEYIREASLVIAATSNNYINKKISFFCKENDILCNVVDNKALSDFIVPSTIKRGNLVISISTMGESPSLSSKIRKELEEKYTEEYVRYVEMLGVIRKVVLQENDCVEGNRETFLKEIVNMNIEELECVYKDIVERKGEMK